MSLTDERYGEYKSVDKTGINMKVFWASIEYKYNGNPMKGGFVYVFVKANSETDAYERITSEFQNLKLSISVIEFLTQYDKKHKMEQCK